jgi:hypothetical protein
MVDNPEYERDGKRRLERIWDLRGSAVSIGTGPLLLATILWATDFITRFNGIDIYTNIHLIWKISGFIGLLALGLIPYIVSHLGRLNMREFLAWGFLVAMFAFILINVKLYDTGVILHIVVPIIIYFKVIKDYAQDKASGYIIFGIIFAIDFFFFASIGGISGLLGYSSVKNIFLNRLIWPVWLLFVLFYTHEKSKIRTIIIIIFILIWFFHIYDETVIYNSLKTSLTTQQIEQAKRFYKQTWNNIKGFGISLYNGFTGKIKRNIELATGETDYYTGQVDANAQEQLGVFLEDVQPADIRFYEDEKVIVWATLVGKTFDEPINVTINCKSDDKDADEIQPDTKEKAIEIAKEEEADVSCSFNPGKLKKGGHTIKLTANFNFQTLAYLKSYFMDKDRLRSMRRENIDVFEQYGITDRNPIAIYTNGPITVGMGTNEPPIGLSKDNLIKPRLGVTLENQWYGRILNITELIIQIPNSMELVNCDHDIKDSNCQNTKEQDYNSYCLSKVALNKLNAKGPIETFRSFRCFINIKDRKAVLGATPIATHYFRAKIRYNYQIDASTYIDVIGGEGIKTPLEGCDTGCKDDDGCICDEKCERKIVTKGQDCGGKKDTIPPAKINDLNAEPGREAGEVILKWTAVGDDGDKGRASRYEIRYSVNIIKNEEDFNKASDIPTKTTIPPPKKAEEKEELIITFEESDYSKKYYFAIIAIDDKEQKSDVSNSDSATVPSATTTPTKSSDECQGKSDGAECKTYGACKSDKCIDKCAYYRNSYYFDKAIGSDWDCVCSLEKCNKLLSLSKCTKEMCLNGMGCCSPSDAST